MSGGGEGQVRVWDVTRQGITSMKEAMKEHKGKITCIRITASDKEVKGLSIFRCCSLIVFLFPCSVSLPVLMGPVSYGT